MRNNSLSRNKYYAFLASLFIHTTLVAASVYLTHEKEEVFKEEESKVLMHLSTYVPALSKSVQATQKQPLIPQHDKKVQPKKVQPKQMEQKDVTLNEQIQRQEEQKQPQTLQEKPFEMASPEAFTPQHVSDEPSKELQTNKPEYSPAKQPSVSQKELITPQKNAEVDPTTLSLIRSMIQNALVYPAMAKRLKLEGVVVVAFTLTRDGRVEDATIIEKSGSSSLDTKALYTVTNLSGTYPALPQITKLQIPIAFSLKKS